MAGEAWRSTRPVTAVIVALVGVALLVALAVAVAWQERQHPSETAIVYGVEESIAFVTEHLSYEAAQVLKASDVRRMLEWSVHYLQEPGVRVRSDLPAVAGGVEAARFVQDRSVEAGVAYDGDLILEVLRLQNEYLASLGAIGDTVDHGNGQPESEGPESA